MRILGRWLSHSVGMALSLILAVLAMQAPAFTREYAGALLQVFTDARRDIDQREASARAFYAIDATEDEAFIKALQAREPSNAETLARSLDRARNLQSAYDDIVSSTPLLQPMVALRDASNDADGYRAAVWKTSLQTYNARLDLGIASAIYGLAGLMLGSLIAQLVLGPFRHAAANRSRSYTAR